MQQRYISLMLYNMIRIKEWQFGNPIGIYLIKFKVTGCELCGLIHIN